MAHTCPDCGQYCNCNGDIDDCCNDFEEDVMRCTHCDGRETDDFEDDYWDFEVKQPPEMEEK